MQPSNDYGEEWVRDLVSQVLTPEEKDRILREWEADYWRMIDRIIADLDGAKRLCGDSRPRWRLRKGAC